MSQAKYMADHGHTQTNTNTLWQERQDSRIRAYIAIMEAAKNYV